MHFRNRHRRHMHACGILLYMLFFFGNGLFPFLLLAVDFRVHTWTIDAQREIHGTMWWAVRVTVAVCVCAMCGLIRTHGFCETVYVYEYRIHGQTIHIVTARPTKVQRGVLRSLRDIPVQSAWMRCTSQYYLGWLFHMLIAHTQPRSFALLHQESCIWMAVYAFISYHTHILIHPHPSSHCCTL